MLYRQRGCTVERRFADMKSFRGAERVSGRTPERAECKSASRSWSTTSSPSTNSGRGRPVAKTRRKWLFESRTAS